MLGPSRVILYLSCVASLYGARPQRLRAASGRHYCQEALRGSFLTRPVTDSSTWWPPDCEWQRNLFWVPEQFAAERQDLKALFVQVCQRWSILAGEAEVVTESTDTGGKGFFHIVLNVTLPFFPYGQIARVQFAALFVQFHLCRKWNSNQLVISNRDEFCTGTDPSDCQCPSILRENLGLLFGSLPARAAKEPGYVGRLLHSFGHWGRSPKAKPFQDLLGIHSRREVWGRFLFRQNITTPGRHQGKPHSSSSSDGCAARHSME